LGRLAGWQSDSDIPQFQNSYGQVFHVISRARSTSAVELMAAQTTLKDAGLGSAQITCLIDPWSIEGQQIPQNFCRQLMICACMPSNDYSH